MIDLGNTPGKPDVTQFYPAPDETTHTGLLALQHALVRPGEFGFVDVLASSTAKNKFKALHSAVSQAKRFAIRICPELSDYMDRVSLYCDFAIIYEPVPGAKLPIFNL